MTVRPPVPHPAPIRRPRHRALLVAVLLTLGVGGAASIGAPVAAEVAHVAQDPGATVTSITTSEPAAPIAEDGQLPLDNAEEVAAENRRIWLVVGGLVLVAIVLLLVTIRYWRQTKPVAPLTEPDETSADPDSAEDDAGPDRGGRQGRRSRRSVAGADHATADSTWEPRGTGEHDRIEPAPASQRARINTDQRRAAYEAAQRAPDDRS